MTDSLQTGEQRCEDDALLGRAMLKQHFGVFLAKCFATVNPGAVYQHNWHVEVIAEHLEACARGDIRRLIINMPPRYLKSLIVNVAWSAYVLGHNPCARIISASYAQSLSVKHAQDARLVMQSEWFRALFPRFAIARDQNEKEKIVTTLRGHRMAVSVGSAVTGEGADMLIVDDPMNPAQALHAPSRELVARWFDHTLSTRLNDKKKGVMVVVMQRLHEDDLCGHLMRRGGFNLLSLPAIATCDEVFDVGRHRWQRSKGELLQPAREDEAMLADMQRTLGSFGFQAQYQQAPVSVEQGMMKLGWFLRFDGVHGHAE